MPNQPERSIKLPPAIRMLLEGQQTDTELGGFGSMQRDNDMTSILNQLGQRQIQMQNQARQKRLSPQNAFFAHRQSERDFTNSLPKPTPVAEDPSIKIMQEISALLNQQGSMPQFDPIELPSFDPNRFKKQAEQSVNSQFNPVIQDLYAQQKRAQGRAASSKQELQNLYSGLAQAYGQDAATGQRQYDAAQAQSQKLYNDERNRIAAGYAADAAAQRAEAKRLGTETLGVNEAIAQQNADKQFADQMMSQQMQSTQNALGQQELAAGDYDRNMANASRYEGIEAQQDVMRQLEDYMGQSDTNIANVRSQAAGSINDLMYKLAQAAYDRDVQNAQFGYQQQRDYIGDANSLADRQLQAKMTQLEMLQKMQGSGSSASERLNPWQQAATFAEQLRPGQGQNLIAAIQGAMNERPEIYARSVDDPVNMNPALFAKLVADSQSGAGLDRNSLMMVAQEIYRLLYGT